MTTEPPAHLIDWHGNDWTPDVRDARRAPERALHLPGRPGPGDRRRVGGPGRRADRRVPLRRAARDRRAARARGVRLGARRLPRRDDELREDGRGRRDGRRAALRPVRDAAVLRLQHGRLLRPLADDRRARRRDKLPKIFYVNWFRKDDDGKFLWPGFGENSRVLEWVFRRCDDAVAGRRDADRPRARRRATSNIDGLDIDAGALEQLLTRRRGGACKAELPAGARAPREVRRRPAGHAARRAREARGAARLEAPGCGVSPRVDAVVLRARSWRACTRSPSGTSRCPCTCRS